jgi:predicted nuclease of restriction endonuclease-like (RecB) superfamily
MNKQLAKDNTLFSIDDRYKNLLTEIKDKIRNTQISIAKAANTELIQLYWWLGSRIVEKQKEYRWGKSVVERLSKDLKATFPATYGFSTQNLWYMRKFYLEYNKLPNLQQLVGEIPWGQNLVIMSKVKDEKAREYYLKATRDMAWTRNLLIFQINNQAYERHVLAAKQHNFDTALPVHLAEQADEAMKDVYMLDMLGVTKPIAERKLEAHIVNKIKDVMLELGYGFSFIGNQYRIMKNGKEYFIDLLFFNRRLKALVALELKLGKFKPEYAGKMNFYLNLLDDFVREKDENPSIGIILCSEKDHFEAEYALRGIDKPVGVSGYKLTKKLPTELSDKLPDIKILEKEIHKELGSVDSEGFNTTQCNKNII